SRLLDRLTELIVPAEEECSPVVPAFEFVGVECVERAILVQVAAHDPLPVGERGHHGEEPIPSLARHLHQEAVIPDLVEVQHQAIVRTSVEFSRRCEHEATPRVNCWVPPALCSPWNHCSTASLCGQTDTSGLVFLQTSAAVRGAVKRSRPEGKSSSGYEI